MTFGLIGIPKLNLHLKRIQNGNRDYDLDKRTLTKIDNYIAKEGLQNQKGLDKYIDQILTEKAERKKNQ